MKSSKIGFSGTLLFWNTGLIAFVSVPGVCRGVHGIIPELEMPQVGTDETPHEDRGNPFLGSTLFDGFQIFFVDPQVREPKSTIRFFHVRFLSGNRSDSTVAKTLSLNLQPCLSVATWPRNVPEMRKTFAADNYSDRANIDALMMDGGYWRMLYPLASSPLFQQFS